MSPGMKSAAFIIPPTVSRSMRRLPALKRPIRKFVIAFSSMRSTPKDMALLKKGLRGESNMSRILFLTLPRKMKGVSGRNCILERSAARTASDSGMSRTSWNSSNTTQSRFAAEWLAIMSMTSSTDSTLRAALTSTEIVGAPVSRSTEKTGRSPLTSSAVRSRNERLPHIIPNGITPCGIKILKTSSPRSNGVEGVSAVEKASMRFFKVVVVQ